MKPIKAEMREQYELATQTYMEALPGSAAHDFLVSRGIGSDTVTSFRLGFVAEPLPGHNQFAGRMCIPNLVVGVDGVERVVGLKFRALGDVGKEPKFLAPPGGGPARLYNLRALAEAQNHVVVVEGESDCWTVAQCGIPCIAVPGAQNWGKPNSYRRRILSGFGRVILVRDTDAPGKDLEKAMAEVDGLEVVLPDPFKDVSEFFEDRGEDALRELILGADK